MITGLYAIAFLFLVFGLYKLFAVIFEVPNPRTIKTIHLIKKSNRKTAGTTAGVVSKLAVFIVPFVKLNPYKQKKLTATLNSLGVEKTPELLHAEGLAKAMLTCLLIPPCFMVFPLISLGVFILALLLYVQAVRKPFEWLEHRRKVIEHELPRLCSNIEQELKNTKDVLGILVNYQKTAGTVLGEELEITIADMKSSNYENAIMRLEGRVNSGMLSNICRGLISILRGDTNPYYFNNLSMELRNIEINELKLEGAKRPRKIKKYIALIMVAFIGGFFVIVGYQILTLLPTLF